MAVCQSTDTWNSWLERADQALYRAKSIGRNRVENECLPLHTGRSGLSNTNLVQLVWRKDYESGNALIDAHHRSLFEQANVLLQAILDNQEKNEIVQLTKSFVIEIEHHFHDEEAIFQQAAYADSEHHLSLHAHLIQRARTLASRFEKDQVGAADLLHFLTYEMVAQHILIDDRKYFSSMPH